MISEIAKTKKRKLAIALKALKARLEAERTSSCICRDGAISRPGPRALLQCHILQVYYTAGIYMDVCHMVTSLHFLCSNGTNSIVPAMAIILSVSGRASLVLPTAGGADGSKIGYALRGRVREPRK